ncbi:MAG: tRNA (guanosine(46)-N7)-methyltransferase TrmB [Clostridia bacterium]|nr:tRNA (guanosine(46)-N7)-methyltransferase TrmB [Clostridia bacterium]
MRMRRKKNLSSRLDKCELLYLSKSTDIYRKKESERYNIVDLKKLFNNENPLEIEIGCGRGQFIVEKAKRNPNVNYIGVEIIDNVIVSAVEKAEAERLKNLYFFNCGAEILHYILPENSVSKIYLNFSCPYPKKQYENHRLTYSYFLNIYKKLMFNEAEIIMKTDSDSLFSYSIDSLSNNGFTLYDVFENIYDNVTSDNIQTEYEEKFLKEGKKIHGLKAKLQK